MTNEQQAAVWVLCLMAQVNPVTMGALVQEAERNHIMPGPLLHGLALCMRAGTVELRLGTENLFLTRLGLQRTKSLSVMARQARKAHLN